MLKIVASKSLRNNFRWMVTVLQSTQTEALADERTGPTVMRRPQILGKLANSDARDVPH